MEELKEKNPIAPLSYVFSLFQNGSPLKLKFQDAYLTQIYEEDLRRASKERKYLHVDKTEKLTSPSSRENEYLIYFSFSGEVSNKPFEIFPSDLIAYWKSKIIKNENGNRQYRA